MYFGYANQSIIRYSSCHKFIYRVRTENKQKKWADEFIIYQIKLSLC